MDNKQKYKVVGSKKRGYAVVEQAGGTAYDLIESLEEARSIRDVLNDGIGPEWDLVEPELERRAAKRKVNALEWKPYGKV